MDIDTDTDTETPWLLARSGAVLTLCQGQARTLMGLVGGDPADDVGVGSDGGLHCGIRGSAGRAAACAANWQPRRPRRRRTVCHRTDLLSFM